MAMMGRLLVGVSAGVSMNVWGRVRPRSRGRDPSHLHCPRDRNGQVVGLRELLGGPQAWPLLLASCLAPGLLQLASLLPLPESPSYLLIDRGDPEACLAALQRLRGTSDLVLELAELEEERAACQGLRARRPWELFHDGTLQRQVTSLVVLGSAMELCGNDPVYACASSVFLEAGVPQEKVQYAIIRTGCCELLSAFFSEGLSHLLYVPFLGICVCGAIYAGFFLPETRGKVILEIS